jgi:hypothetical protein
MIDAVNVSVIHATRATNERSLVLTQRHDTRSNASCALANGKEDEHAEQIPGAGEKFDSIC